MKEMILIRLYKNNICDRVKIPTLQTNVLNFKPSFLLALFMAQIHSNCLFLTAYISILVFCYKDFQSSTHLIN